MRIGDLVRMQFERSTYTWEPEEVEHREIVPNGRDIHERGTGTVTGISRVYRLGLDVVDAVTVRWETGLVRQYLIQEQSEESRTWFDLMVVTPLHFINTYRKHRLYGGPEEGGWYYDQDEPVASEWCRLEDVPSRLAELQAAVDLANEGQPSLDSVLSEGTLYVIAEAWAEREESSYAKPSYC